MPRCHKHTCGDICSGRAGRAPLVPSNGRRYDRVTSVLPAEGKRAHVVIHIADVFLSRVTHVPVRTLQAISGNWRYARQTSVAAAPAVRCCFICGAVASPRTPGRPLSRLCSYLANDAPLHGLGTTYIFRYEPIACRCTSSPASSDSGCLSLVPRPSCLPQLPLLRNEGKLVCLLCVYDCQGSWT